MRNIQLKVAVVMSYVYMALSFLVSLVYTPVMLSFLGQSEYGLYSLALSVIGYLSILNFGFGSAYMRYYSRLKINNNDKEIAKLNAMFLLIFILIAIITIVLGIIFGNNSDFLLGSNLSVEELSKSRILMIIMAINIALTFPLITFNSYITANEKFIFQKLMQIFTLLLNPIITLPILILGYGSIGMVIITILVNIIIGVFNVLYSFKKLGMKFSFKGLEINLVKDMFIFSFFIFMNMISAQISWSVDKLILGRLYGTATVAIYALAAKVNTIYMTAGTSISQVFIPKIHNIVASSDSNNLLTDIFTKIGRIQFMILALISSGFVFFGRRFLELWVGNEYELSYEVIIILIIPVTIPLIQNISHEIQRAKNMHKFSTIVFFIIAILNVTISIPLARLYQSMGAAIGTAIALLIGNGLIMNWYFYKKIRLNIMYFWLEILKILPGIIIPLIYGILIQRYFENTSVFVYLVSGIGYVLVYSISLWFLGLNKFEKDLIIKPLQKVLLKKNQ